MMCISTIALDALLKLVGGQVIQKLGEDGLSGIHPSLSAISVVGSHLPIAAGSADVIFKSKNESYKLKSVLCDDYGRRCDFSRTLLIAINWFIFRTITPVSSMAKHLKTGFRLHFESLLPITRSDLTLHGGLQGWFFILPLIIAVIGLGWLTVSSIRNRSFDQPVQFAVYAFPLVHLGLLAMLSDWALWMWYFYPLVFVLCFACVQCFQAKSRPNRPVLRLPLEAIGIVVVMLATIRTIARERKTTPDFNTVYTCGVELARFANLHPGRYAMGDRAGIVGYLSANPTIQLEGLMMDKKFIETLRRAPKLNSVLDEYNIDYYIASHPRLVDSCYEVVEPAQAGPESPKMRGSFCEKPVFTVERNGSFNAVFRVKPLTQAANTAIR